MENNELALEKIVYTNKRERNCVECTTLGGVIIPIIHLNKYKVYLYGVAANAFYYINYLAANDVIVQGIIDNDEQKNGKYVTDTIKYIHTSELNAICDTESVFVIIVTRYYEGIECSNITNVLYKANITKYYYISDMDNREILAASFYGTISFYREHYNELKQTYEMLCDEESKKIMLEYLRVQQQCGVYSLSPCEGKYKYFFGKGKGEHKEKLYKHLDNEVWINCGSSIGDTIYLYFDNQLKAKKIYAYEGDKDIYVSLKHNLQYLPSDLFDKVIPVNEYISNDTDFSKYIDESVSLINADIEGNELAILHAMEEVIKRDRPVLAICVYHKNSDLIDIPRYIRTLVNDYSFCLRKYESSIIDINRCWEMVFYAIPNERYLLDKNL